MIRINLASRKSSGGGSGGDAKGAMGRVLGGGVGKIDVRLDNPPGEPGPEPS